MQRFTTIVGYGSLMSAYGISHQGPIRIARTRRIAVNNARRGFGKASLHGDRFAMVLEPIETARRISGAISRRYSGSIEALAFDATDAVMPAICQREGYSPSAWASLERFATEADRSVSRYLAVLMDEANGDLVGYRRALYALLGYTSSHYIPHPIDVDGEDAVIFLSPGAEGTGATDVTSVRITTGVCDLMSISQVWQRKPTPAQLDYIAMCWLATAHDIDIGDLGSDIPSEVLQGLASYETHLANEKQRLRQLAYTEDH